MAYNPICEEIQHDTNEEKPIKNIPHFTITTPYYTYQEPSNETDKNYDGDDPYCVIVCDGDKTVAVQIDPDVMFNAIQWLIQSKKRRMSIEKHKKE